MRAVPALGVVLCLILIGLGLRWAAQHYVETPSPSAHDGDSRLRFPHAAHLAIAAAQAFRALPDNERTALRAQLQDALWSLPRWLDHINVQAPQMLCVGERHRHAARRFLSSRMLPGLELDVMMLEADNLWVQQALTAHAAGEPIPELLGATMTPVINALAIHHPNVPLVGIDESDLERKARRALSLADLSRRLREDTLVTNLRRRWHPGRRHLVLFGALHCRDLPQWFFARLPRESDVVKRSAALNVVLLARHQEPAIQGLMYLLEEIGLPGNAWAVPHSARFPAPVLRWLPHLSDAFANYESAILFDEDALAQR